MAKTIDNGKCIEINPINDLVRIDGAPICQVLVNTDTGRLWLRFLDTDKHRSIARGTRFIDVPLDVFVEAVADHS